MVKKRDLRIDALRFIGTLLVILAHVGAPAWIQNIRTFDVVMLVLISGMSINKSRNIKNYPIYIYQRLKKMILPLYIVLTIIFLINFVTSILFNITSSGINSNVILDSYLLLDGIGYVWIVRVFLFVALVAPVFPLTVKKLNTLNFFISLGSLYIIYVIICNVFVGDSSRLFNYFFIETIPYILIAAIGYRIYQNTKEQKYIFFWAIIGLVVVTISHLLSNQDILPNNYKYPPGLQYVFYGLLVSILLFFIIGKYEKIRNLFANRFVKFVSIHSYDIYVIHILSLFIYNAFQKLLKISFKNDFIFKYLFVLVITLFIVWTTKQIGNLLKRNKKLEFLHFSKRNTKLSR
ncbi:acyltransferase family protein [Priestia aryabhattai]|uniref:acyltransferase family protein n=1 Tax=Priestia aryabhattai TaxID=412384 RepID=UPI0005EC7A24|nr:acyltransferase [Priestia aryabhattai]KJL04080.1 hypothetical protein N178_14810 [Priestia aryabhattai B8W22]